ncbi:hypothetical protein GCM10007425_18000 [Lysinibacillus alkalisoli]|uniref:Uncharacterized protein n=1 Tax=Lysinibacillus alkalisoli TaxID=1911548 RepID=A0A917G5L4_9BACI|nr:hypothetical protein GCM10007425_18000 [Lysinibacillus alkalisoli]
MNFIEDFISKGPLINALQDGWKNTFQQIEYFPKLTKRPYNITRFNAEAELLFLLMVSKNFNFEISHPKLTTKFVSLNDINPIAYPYRIN